MLDTHSTADEVTIGWADPERTRADGYREGGDAPRRELRAVQDYVQDVRTPVGIVLHVALPAVVAFLVTGGREPRRLRDVRHPGAGPRLPIWVLVARWRARRLVEHRGERIVAWSGPMASPEPASRCGRPIWWPSASRATTRYAPPGEVGGS